MTEGLQVLNDTKETEVLSVPRILKEREENGDLRVKRVNMVLKEREAKKDFLVLLVLRTSTMLASGNTVKCHMAYHKI